MSTLNDSDRPHATLGDEITKLLDQARDGDSEALEALVSAVYRELRRRAANMVRREPQDLTLAATDVVHETFLRLFARKIITWRDRREFFTSAATAMRHVFIDHARHRRAGKRIPKSELVQLELADVFRFPDFDLLALDAALNQLVKDNPRQAQIVELRFFAGLTETEISEILGLSRMTISRDWKVARLRLKRELRK